jgi:hypothetical protein
MVPGDNVLPTNDRDRPSPDNGAVRRKLKAERYAALSLASFNRQNFQRNLTPVLTGWLSRAGKFRGEKEQVMVVRRA